jgi:tetratricopeptide (TPR) repeat protein
MERGEAYFEEEQYAEAIIEFRSALQLEPNHGGAHYRLAHAYLRTEKVREGFWELRETIRLDPANLDAKLEFAQIATIAGRNDDKLLEEALQEASAVVEAEPDNVTALVFRGNALGWLGREDEALVAFQKAVEVDPEHEGALRRLAVAHEGRGHDEEVQALFAKLTEIHPSYENYAGKALYLWRRWPGRTDEIEAALDRAFELATPEERAQAYLRLSNFYAVHKRMDEAVALLEQGISEQEDERKLGLIYGLARLHRALGNAAAADELIEESAEARPDDPAVHLVISAYRARNGDLEGGLAAATRAHELDPESRDARLQQAEMLLEIGARDDRPETVKESRAIIEAILVDEPSLPRGLFLDARLKLLTGQRTEAIGSLRAALEARRDWAEGHYLLGAVLAADENFAAARGELARALELDAALLKAKEVITRVHYRLGEWEYCVQRGREVLRERPEDEAVRVLVAQSLIRLERLDDAEKMLAEVPAEQRGGEVHYALGRIHLARGRLPEAREDLETALQERPTNREILQALLALDRAEGRLDESRQRIAKAVEADPGNGGLYQLQGMLAAAEGDPAAAEASLQKAIEVAPKDMSGYEALASFYARTGRLEETARTYEKAIEVNPENGRLHHFLGVLYELSGDRERAVARYEDAIRYEPDLAEAKNNLAYIYAASDQNLDRALDLAQDAKALMPNNPSVADTLGWVLFKRGVYPAAISYLREAEATTQPSDASLGEVRFHLAQAYEKNGDSEEALASLDRSLETLAEQVEAAEARGEEPGPEPSWAAEARAMRERTLAARTSGG